jgi:histidine kinase
MDKINHIFDRFYRVDNSRNRKNGGSGLGLSIAKQIIESHKGKIWAESSLGNGTTIFFSLKKVEVIS